MALKISLEKPVVFFPQIARAVNGINEALFWQQCYYWNERTKRTDGFFYKTISEFQDETFLTPYQQRKVRENLVQMGVLEEKKIKANGAPTMHFRVIPDVMEKLISDYEETSFSNVKKLNNPITENTTDTTTNVVADKSADAPKENSIKKNFYLVVKKYSLPIMNHKHIDSWCEKLVAAHGEVIATAYLVRLQQRDLRQESQTEKFVPTLNRAMDILDKSNKIIAYFTRTKEMSTETAHDSLLEGSPFPADWPKDVPEMKTVEEDGIERQYFRGVRITASNQVALMEYKQKKSEREDATQ